VEKGKKRHIVSAWMCFSTYLHQRQILPREQGRSTSKDDIMVSNRYNDQIQFVTYDLQSSMQAGQSSLATPCIEACVRKISNRRQYHIKTKI